MARPTADGEPVAAALDLARSLFARAIANRRPTSDAYAVSPRDVEDLLTASEAPRDAAHDATVERMQGRLRRALAEAPTSRLARLHASFGLDEVDLEIVAVLVAPELAPELERVVVFVLDDFTRKQPNVGVVARLVGGGNRARCDDALAHLADDARLRRLGIVHVTAARDVSATSRLVRVADRIASYLRGHDPVDDLVRDHVRLDAVQRSPDELVLKAETRAQIDHALAASSARVLLTGAEGSGRALAAEVHFGARGGATVRIELAELVAGDAIRERVHVAVREAVLRDAVAILDGGTLGDEVPAALPRALADCASSFAIPIVFVWSKRPQWLADAVPDLVEVTVPSPGFRDRQTLWRQALPSGSVSDEDVETVSARYAFTGGTIARAARRAVQSAALRDPDRPHVNLDDLGEASRLMFANRLGGMAQRIATGFSWADLVLPRETHEAVLEVVEFAHYKPYLLESWGFAAKLPYGRGVSAILAGPPGTGKTMVAQILAKELGYDLYRIDLSQVVNKYIGETEKNLGRIFDEAEASHAVLFFDEADALFSKRSEVKSSNDRYANLEVNYLLQRMETYDGVTLLATNLEQGLDEAFKRRVRFSIAFELPERDERRRLWRSMIPSEVPLEGQIDWDLLASKFEMAGGYIKKAVLRAALLAVKAKRPVTTRDLLDAAGQEYREMGRII